VKSATISVGGAGGAGELSGATPADEGEVRMTLGTAVPTLGRLDESEDPEDDAALVAAGYAAITPIVGVQEDMAPGTDEIVRTALATVDRVLER
jgi:hypothetical protein